MQKRQNLVVIGNGMAGARVVEDILQRGGADLFNITMFGDEPFGNYNRILLSNVLNGSQDESEIYLNTLPWYVENKITLHAGVSAESIQRRAKFVTGNDGKLEFYDKLIVTTAAVPTFRPLMVCGWRMAATNRGSSCFARLKTAAILHRMPKAASALR